jgi:tetratricopeptide (TPR) repeat protein
LENPWDGPGCRLPATGFDDRSTIYWNTLGVAHCRLGEWEAAIQALEEAARLAPDRDFRFNAFFLAMCRHQLGDPAKAKDHYDRAVRWCQENQGNCPPPSNRS